MGTDIPDARKSREQLLRELAELRERERRAAQAAGSERSDALRRAEAEVQKARDAARHVLERINDGFFSLDRDFRFVYLNEKAALICRMDRAALLGRNIWDAFPEARGTRWQTEYERAVRDRVHVHFEEYYTPFDEWFEVDAYPADEGLSIFSRVVTERKRAERELAESARRLRFAVEAAGMIAAGTDRELRYTWIVNPHPDFDADAVLGKRDDELDSQQAAVDLVALKREVLGTGAPARRELCFRRSDGLRWYDVVVEPRADERGRRGGVVTAAIDVTGLKRNQEELRRAKELAESLVRGLERKVAERTAEAEARALRLQELAIELIEAEERERRRIATVLHDDLQQVLVGTKMQVQAAQKDRPGDPMLETVGRLVDDSIHKSRSLTHELSPPVLRGADLAEAIQWLARQMKRAYGLDVEVHLPVETGEEASFVTMLVFRSVQELLFNVVKHAETTRARVGLSRPRGGLRVVVSDAGRGFDRRHLDLSGRWVTGFGLLSIRERIQALGGRLEIDSTPGEGSRFTLELPRYGKAVENEPEAGVLVPPGGLSRERALRVVFVDDHKVVRQGLTAVMRNLPNIEIVGEAANGVEAIRRVRDLHPDVVVMDVSMPGMDGMECTRRIKAEHPDVRVIALSMHDSERIREAMREAGAEAFVLKSDSTGNLAKAIYGMMGSAWDAQTGG